MDAVAACVTAPASGWAKCKQVCNEHNPFCESQYALPCGTCFAEQRVLCECNCAIHAATLGMSGAVQVRQRIALSSHIEQWQTRAVKSHCDMKQSHHLGQVQNN